MAKIFVPRNFFFAMQPMVGGGRDKRQVHFHFRPVRPADLLICLDPISDEVNMSGGTYGPLSNDPFAIALHVHRSSHDSQRNVAQRPPGTEVVVALPGRNIVAQTWHGALPCPRGINEADVARLTLYPSKLVQPPSIAECPVNLECVVDAVYHSGGSDSVFCRVLGATIDEEILGKDRLDLIREYPTHECDDLDNQWGGANLVRSSYLASLDLPPNINHFQIARLTPVTSPYGPVPHVAECPLNHECIVGQIVDYHSTRVYFLHVEYASLDEEILPMARESVVQRYHLWEVDRARNSFGGERLRFGMVGEIYQCPTFPVNGKVGWCNSFLTWMRDLKDEGYLSNEEFTRIIAWNYRFLEIFDDGESPERDQLRQRLTTTCQAVAWQEWERLHAFLSEETIASVE